MHQMFQLNLKFVNVFSLGVMNREYQLDAQTSLGRKVKILNHFYKNIAYIKPHRYTTQHH